MKRSVPARAAFKVLCILVSVGLVLSGLGASASQNPQVISNSVLVGMTEFANLKYGGLKHDYENHSKKHLGFISAELSQIGIKVGYLMSGQAYLYFDLDDYYSAMHPDEAYSDEGSGTNQPEGQRWVTIWLDVGYSVLGGSAAPDSKVNFGLATESRYQTEDDPLRNWGLTAFSASAGSWFEIKWFTKDEYGFHFGEDANSSSSFIPEASAFSVSKNMLRGEIKKEALDLLFDQAFSNMQPGMIGYNQINSGAMLLLQTLLEQNGTDIDLTNRLDINWFRTLPIRQFTSTDEGTPYFHEGGSFKSIVGGMDLDSDGIPDNQYPAWNTTGRFAKMNVNVYLDSSQTANYYVKVKSVTPDLLIGALDNEGSFIARPFSEVTLLTGFVADQEYTLSDVPPATSSKYYLKTEWAVTAKSTLSQGDVVFEMGVYRCFVICIHEPFATLTKTVKVVSQIPSGQAPIITHTRVTSAYSNQDIVINASITSGKPLTAKRVAYDAGDGVLKAVDMTNLGDTNYRGVIPAIDVRAGILQYYVTAYDGLTFTNSPNEASEWHDVQVTDPPTRHPTVSLVTVTADKTQYQPNEAVTLNVALKDDYNSALTGATLQYTLNGIAYACSSSGVTCNETGNGNYTVRFPAPATSGNFDVVVSASKSGFQPGSGATTISVYAYLATGHNVSVNQPIVNKNGSNAIDANNVYVFNNGTYSGTAVENVTLYFRARNPSGIVVDTESVTLNLAKGQSSPLYSRTLHLGTNPPDGSYSVEVEAVINGGFIDEYPSDNKKGDGIWFGVKPTFLEYGLCQMTGYIGQWATNSTGGTSVDGYYMRVNSVSSTDSSARIDIAKGSTSNIIHSNVKVYSNVLSLFDGNLFAVICTGLIHSVPGGAIFDVGKGGNSGVVFTPGTAVVPAGTDAKYHLTAPSTNWVLRYFVVDTHENGDDYDTVRYWNLDDDQILGAWDVDLFLSVPPNATAKTYSFWLRFDDRNNTAGYSDIIRKLFAEVHQPHDIQIASINPSGGSVTGGDAIPVVATIQNLSSEYTEYGINVSAKIVGPNGYQQIWNPQTITSLGPNASTSITFDWVTNGLVEGNYTLTIDVPVPQDAYPSNNTTATTYGLTLPPLLSVSASTDKTAYVQQEPIQLNADVTSNGTPVTDASVIFYLKDTGGRTVQSGNLLFVSNTRYSQTIVAPIATGTYTVTAVASKQGCRAGTGQTSSLSINTAPPQTVILSDMPSEGQLVSANDLAFGWSGTSLNVPTSQLEYSYRLDGQLWSSFTAATSVLLLDIPDGPHTFEVKARQPSDPEDPTPATRFFTIDTVAPIFDVTPSANQSYYSDGQTIQITIDLAEPARVAASFSAIDSEFSPASLTVAEINPTNHVYRLDYPISASNTTPDKAVAVTINAVDNAGNVGLNSALIIRLDNYTPAILSTNPDSAQTDVPLSSTITILFSENMNKATVQPAISFLPSTAGQFGWPQPWTLVFTPTVGLTCDTLYTVTASSAAQDLIGRPLTPITWTFRTQRCLPGAFTKSNPSNGATGQPTNPTLSWGTSTGATSYEYCYDTTNNSSCDGSWTSVGSSTSVGLSGLNAGVTYYWQVRARNAAGTTDANSGVWWSFTTQVGLPGAFNKSSPSNGATGQATSPTLSWGSSSGVTSYEYCYDTTNNSSCDGSWASVGSSTSVGLSGLNAGVTYYWQVRARNAAGTTDANSGVWWSFTTQVGLPGSFNKSSPSNGATGQATSPTLSWGSSSGVTSYEYCYDTTNNNSCDGSWASVGSTTSVGLSGLNAGVTYYWQVRARNAAGTTDANSGVWWSFTTQVGLPGSFNKSSPSNGATGQATSPTLSWGSSSGVTSYEYCYDTTNNNSCDGSWASVGSSTSVGLSGLSAGTIYYWQVRARNAAGATDADSGAWWSFGVGSIVPNDDFSNALLISNVPYSNAQSIAGATTATDDPAFACVSGQKYNSVWYRYTPSASGMLTVTTFGSTYDTVLAVWTGTRGALQSRACNDDTTGRQSQVATIVTAGVTYYIEVAAYYSTSVGTLTLSATLAARPAGFNKISPLNEATGQPTSPTLSWGSSSGATSYEYCYDATNNGSCDGSWTTAGSNTSVELSGLSWGTTYYWQARARNAVGTTDANDGAWWSFSVRLQVPNDDFNNPIVVLNMPYFSAQSIAGATTTSDDPTFSCVSGQRYHSVWYRYTSSSSGTLVINTFGSDYDTILAIWVGPRGALQSRGCNDDSATTQSQVTLPVVAGEVYYIEVASYGPVSSGVLNLSVSPVYRVYLPAVLR